MQLLIAVWIDVAKLKNPRVSRRSNTNVKGTFTNFERSVAYKDVVKTQHVKTEQIKVRRKKIVFSMGIPVNSFKNL